MSLNVEKAKEILEAIQKDAFLIPEEYREWWQAYLKSHTPHYLNILSLMGDAAPHARILEIGSSPGHCTALLKQLGFDITGLDIDPEWLSAFWNRYDLPVWQVDVEKDSLPCGENTFDVVLLTEVFEHLRLDPIHALQEVYRVLKPEGILVFSIPNITPVHRIRFLVGRDYQDTPVRAFQKLRQMGYCGHFRMYSRSEAIEILKYTGFTIQKMSRKGKLPRRIWKIIAFLSGPFQDRFRSHIYFLCEKPCFSGDVNE